MATTDDAHTRRAGSAAPPLPATLARYAVMLLAGAAGLVAALDHGSAWGWALAGAALLAGVALADQLAELDRAQRQ